MKDIKNFILNRNISEGFIKNLFKKTDKEALKNFDDKEFQKQLDIISPNLFKVSKRIDADCVWVLASNERKMKDVEHKLIDLFNHYGLTIDKEEEKSGKGYAFRCEFVK